jgi:vancomycin resistance protein YoaR
VVNENKPSTRRKRNQIDLVAYFRHLRDFLKKITKVKHANYAITVGVLVLALGLLYTGDNIVYANRVHPGVSVDGVNLSGLTKSEAKIKIQKAFSGHSKKQLVIKYKERKWDTKPADFKIKINAEKTVEKALDYGRNGNMLKRVLDKFRAVAGVSIKGDFKCNNAELSSYVKDIVDSVSVKPQNADISITKGKPFLVSSKRGRGLGFGQTFLLIKHHLCSLKEKSIILKPEDLYPSIDNDLANKNLKLARLMTSGDVIVNFKKKEYLFSKKDIAYSFATKPLTSKTGLYLYLSPEKFQKRLSLKTKGISSEPVSATFIVDGKNVSISQSKMGLMVDFRKTAKLATLAAKSKNRVISLAVKYIKPKRTTADARKMGVKTLVSSFTTYYQSGKPRVQNIHKVADILDKRMIAPGGKFSFNEYVGERKAENGFVKAPEIVSGTHVDNIGGGICQVATTFFNTVLIGAYPFGQRSPHSMFIKNYPAGRDATVSWPQPDFTFTNDTQAWILIKTEYNASSLTIKFYSTDYGRKVSFDTKFKGSIHFPTEQIKDNTLEKGKEKEKQAGVLGRIYEVTRIVTKDGSIIRKETFTSRYNPEKRVLLVGTKETPEEIAKKKAEAEKKKQQQQQTQPQPVQ